MESFRSGLSAPQNQEYLNSSVHFAFSAADLALEHDLSDIRSLENTEKSTTLDASRRAGGGGGCDGDADDDCNSIAEELEYLASYQAQEIIREELSEAEDCWRQSLSNLIETKKDQDNVSVTERDESDDASGKPLDEDNESKAIRCDNLDQIGPEQIIGIFKRILFRKNSDDESLSTEEDSLQCIDSFGFDTAERRSGTEMAESSETRRPEPLTIDTQIPSCASTTTNELLFPESSMGVMMSSALLHKGHHGMSLALASDMLASQIYSQQSLLPYWLNKQLADRSENEKLSPTKTHWLLGIPLIGSASKDGQVWLMEDDSDPNTLTSLVEDEILDDMEAL